MRTSYSMAIPGLVCIHKRAVHVHACVYVYAHVGAATETKFDCREAKGLFYMLQTNRMRDAK